MKKNIYIIGGAGYIGSAVTDLYSGEGHIHSITVIDKNFLSARVSDLRSKGIKFLHKDALLLTKEDLQDAHVIVNLAGVTNVPFVQSQSDKDKDEEIKRNGVDVNEELLFVMPKKCKYIFVSTHVIYEGLQEVVHGILETETPCPVLAYSKGKLESEYRIQAFHMDYIILRLGSVVGDNGYDNTRVNIMPNLFSKIASQNGAIQLFGGGKQIKSLVPLKDVARAIKFFAESDYSGEIYNVVSENYTIKEVSEICKSVNPKVELIETDDEVPNLGYTMSNKKLFDTGFKFLYNIEDTIKEMIEKWSSRKLPTDLEYIITGQKEFIDERGKISNYELPEPINLIGYIESKAGTVRANHYHPIQEQKCLLISGRYVSVVKDLSDPKAREEYRVIRAGDIAVIKANVAHTMVFLQDSIFLNLVRGEREHENYGVTHTIPYELVNEDKRLEILNTYLSKCRVCGNGKLKQAISLGMSPLANNLTNSTYEEFEEYPLDLDYCPTCYNVQLSVVVPPRKMFDNYLYTSSTSPTFRKHFENAAEKYIKEFNLNSNSTVLDIGSNDGIGLKPFKDRGIKVVGIEPAKNLCDLANENGIPTIHGYVNKETIQQVIKQFGKVDLVTASNVFAHADNLKDIAECVFSSLNEEGMFIVEVQHIGRTLQDLTFDNIYHEHTQYWSAFSLNWFLNGLVAKVENIDTHGGSIRCYIQHPQSQNKVSIMRNSILSIDKPVSNFKSISKFATNVAQLKKNANENIRYLKSKYKTIAGYGSPAKATTALNYFGIGNEFIDYTIEDNELKHGKYIPKVNIPIVGMKYAETHKPDIIIVLAWNFFESIRDKISRNIGMLAKANGNTATMYIISIKDLQLPPNEFKQLA